MTTRQNRVPHQDVSSSDKVCGAVGSIGMQGSEAV